MNSPSDRQEDEKRLDGNLKSIAVTQLCKALYYFGYRDLFDIEISNLVSIDKLKSGVGSRNFMVWLKLKKRGEKEFYYLNQRESFLMRQYFTQFGFSDMCWDHDDPEIGFDIFEEELCKHLPYSNFTPN